MIKISNYVLWFTGLSGSGKTTIANLLVELLREKGNSVVLLDGDTVRETLSRDLGYTKTQRNKHIKRVANVCYLISKSEVMSVACVISPSKKIRKFARNLIGDNFIEIFIKCPINVCAKRDVKGHYEKAKKGEIDFVGFNVPYEEPENPEIVIETNKETVIQAVEKIMNFLLGCDKN